MNPLKILTILGQFPGMTGSGVLLRELYQTSKKSGDQQFLVFAGYPDDHDFGEEFKVDYSLVSCSKGSDGNSDVPFPIPGMSDVMPYKFIRYADLDNWQVDSFIGAYRKHITKAIHNFKPDLIHINHLWVLIALADSCGDLPCFLTIHGTGLKQLEGPAKKFKKYVEAGIDKISFFFSVSEEIRKKAIDAYSIPEEKIASIGNGFNPTIFTLNGPVLDLDTPVILCAGKYVKWKGFRFVIRACSLLSIPFRLVILGTGPEHEKEALLEEAKRAGISDRMTLLGHLPQGDVAVWMRSSDVFIQASQHEPFGLVFLEAMACGCPIIASASGGVNDIIPEDLLVPKLAQLIESLDVNIADDEERYIREIAMAIKTIMQKNVRSTDRVQIAESMSKYTWEFVYRMIRKKYRDVLGEVP